MDWTKPALVKLPKIADARGNLSVIQSMTDVPFEIARCYWIYDIPSGLHRDGHAYYAATELIVALSGGFDVEVDDGREIKTFRLDRPDKALFIPPLCWRGIKEVTTNSVAMVLSSTLYDSDDYIVDYQLFRQIHENR